MFRSFDYKLTGRFVIGMVDSRQPVTGAVRPVIAEKCALVKHPGKIGCKTLAQPDVVLIGLGDGIAKPLVGNFMSDKTFVVAFAGDSFFVVENCAGVFHAAVLCS